MANVLQAAYPRAALALLNTAVTGLLVALAVRLFQNNLVPTPFTVTADLTEATFTGYVKSAVITWGTVFTNADGSASFVGDEKTFVMTDVVALNTIYGAYYTSGADPGVSVVFNRFATPANMAYAFQGVTVQPIYTFPGP